jgi:chromosome segregation ATPase
VEIKINKSFFIKLAIVIILCVSCFLCGRYIRFTRISENGAGTQQLITNLTEQLESVQSELDTRIQQCEQLQGQLNQFGSVIDESIRTAGLIRTELEQSRLEIKGSNPILNELRTRFAEYEARIRQLEENLAQLETGSYQQ